MKRFRIVLFLVFLIFQSSYGDDSRITKSGLDKVVDSNFQLFQGKTVGLICNHTSLDKNGQHIVDLFHEKTEVKAIFAPEHGFRGSEAAGAKIDSGKDIKTGISIYSLYGKTRKPTEEMLKDIDVLVYDIQDVGVRFYTYISTMTKAMEAAAELGVEFVVLDRPNPIRGDILEGGVMDEEYKSFVGMHDTPIRYGLTVGEFANFINEEGMLAGGVKADLTIIKMDNWHRNLWYDETGMNWIAPSPNMPDLTTAIVYPGMCLLEGTNMSEGRGTDTPFLLFGAPWLNSEKVIDKLESVKLSGVEFSAQPFTPENIKGKAYNPKFKDQQCNGIKLTITDRNSYEPLKTMVYILSEVSREHSEDFQWKETWIKKLTGNGDLEKAIADNQVKRLLKKWRKYSKKFQKHTKKYLFYK